MTDRERVAELLVDAEDKCQSAVSYVGAANYNERQREAMERVAKAFQELNKKLAGYTRQTRPQDLASISETNDVPAPISEAKRNAGTEPSPERVEAVADKLALKFENRSFDVLYPDEQKALLNFVAREILSLFPEPVLKVMDKIGVSLKQLLYERVDKNGMVDKYDIDDWWESIHKQIKGE